jgi:hypothetical protein
VALVLTYLFPGTAVQTHLYPGTKKEQSKSKTYHTILDRETQLVLCVWPLDFHFNYWGTGHSRQLHSRLIFGILKKKNQNSQLICNL